MREGRLSGRAIVCALAMGLLLAGCGSSRTDGSSWTTTIATATKTTTTAVATQRRAAPTNATSGTFVVRARGICDTSNKLIEGAAKKTLPGDKTTKPTRVQLLIYAKLVKRALLAQIRGIRTLASSPDDKARVASMLSHLGGDLEKVQADPALLENSEVFADFAKLARSYGLTSCVPKGR